MELQIALISLATGVVTTILTVFYAPAWKGRVDARRERRDRSERLIVQYGEPLARAAFDLQSRLYNIIGRNPRTVRERPELIDDSTLWLFGQYLAWVEIFRREVQLMDLGEIRRTAELQQRLYEITEVLSSGRMDPVFRILRPEQRAIGEIMVVDRQIAGQSRSDSMGFAEFRARQSDPAFNLWFTGLAENMRILRENGADGALRGVCLQRELIRLIDFLDPDRIRFPNVKERGMLSLPSNAPDGIVAKQERNASRSA
ncbi:hypothetical protein ACQP25_18170 [Microtetraspora malaysiensis]|uniref:hypothetical protein n=1 Tax=Microtetraspora malaysiensis TaxID=161358 RepID=UPI003D8D3C5B